MDRALGKSLKWSIIFALCCTRCTYAYIGPGVGMSAVGVLVGLISGGFLVVFGLAWYPIGRILERIKKKRRSLRSQKERHT